MHGGVDQPHSTFAEHALDVVFTGDAVADLRELGRHGNARL
jgi:hypothetical protein